MFYIKYVDLTRKLQASKELGNCDLCKGEGKQSKNCLNMSPNVGFSKDLKSTIINMLKELKETMFK